MTIVCGADIGQTNDPTSIVAAEARHGRYTVRLIEQIPTATPYEEVDARLVEIALGLLRFRLPHELVTLRIDCTGVGKPVYDHVASMLRDTGVRGISTQGFKFTYGEAYMNRDTRDGLMVVGKGMMVGRLRLLFNTGRIRMADSQKAALLQKELSDFELRIRERERSQRPTLEYGALKTGTHDDLVTALGLATLYDTDDLDPDEGDTIEDSLPAYLRP